MALNPGAPGFGMPPAEDDAVRKQRDLERQARENAAARSLAASQIGAGGTLKVDGNLEVTGTLSVPAGSLNTAGAISAGTTVSAGTSITAGGAITGASVAASGAVTGATVAATGQVSGDTGVFHGGLYSTNARNFVVANNYAGSWIDIDGHFGISPSSAEFKQDFAPADAALLVDALYSIGLLRFRYIKSVEEHGENAATELGGIAEYFAGSPLNEYVFRNADGQPQGINYERLTIPLIAVIQDLNGRVKALEAAAAATA